MGQKRRDARGTGTKLSQKDQHLKNLVQRYSVFMDQIKDAKELQQKLIDLNNEWEIWLRRHPIYFSVKALNAFMEMATAYIKFRTTKGMARIAAAKANNSPAESL